MKTPSSYFVNLRGSFFKAVLATMALSASAQAQAILDFDFTHGSTVTDQYKTLYGVSISAISLEYNAENPEGVSKFGDVHNAIVFDTTITGATSDPDLQRTGVDAAGWKGGNLGPDYVVGGALILPENDEIDMGTGLYTDPDDNVDGGVFTFVVDDDRHYTSFSTILVDFEEGGAAWDIKILGQNGQEITLSYSDVLDEFNALYDPTVTAGDNYANVLPVIDVAEYGLDRIKQLDITLNRSSGAIGEIVFNPKDAIPEPSSSLMILVAGVGFVLRRRR